MKFISLFTFVFMVNIVLSQDSFQNLLYKGTVVKARLTQTVSTKTASKGQLIHFILDEDVTVNGKVIISEGTEILGTILIAKKAKYVGTNGQLDFTIDYIKLKDGRNVPLKSSNEITPKEDKQLGVIAATALIHPLFLLIKGKDVIIEEGKVFEIFVAEDFSI
ncbi:MAG TPA: hypothetical protein PKD85_16565 [Saprospiraceae bacterium]|nr:hypothetical protein [Saprospiraceae bacterium]